MSRTTRSVSPTEAGERLLRTVGPRFDEIEAAVAALSEFRDKPAGTIRITSGDHAADTILWPVLRNFLPNYPDVKVEIMVDYMRLPTYGGLYAWEFEKGRRELTIRVDGQLIFNGIYQILDAALGGFGLAYVPQDLAEPLVAEGRLQQVLEDWCPPFSATTSITRAAGSPRPRFRCW